MDNLSKNNWEFLSEQDGETEREFKREISSFFERQKNLVRAYLAQIKYESQEGFSVALFLKSSHNDTQHLLDGVGKIFKEMFGRGEHLDIIFLSEEKELILRAICCPFYTSKNYQINAPDFYLTSSEGYDLEQPVACYKRKKLNGKNSDGYMLCDIKPSLDGSKYLAEKKHIHQVVFASRHKNYSLFPILVWPAYVHVAVPLKNDSFEFFEINEQDLKLIAWGELYKQHSEIKRA